ncbi:MAG: effector [Candidatus Phytoplasma australasiaticum]|nr:effector [Candidatus Phytoplasma australasiaticum]
MQKYFIKIMVILLLGITIIIMIHKNHHCTSKNQSPLSSWESEKETLDYYEAFKIKKLFSTRLKRSAEEQLIPKIKITATRLEKIKNYIFSEPINPALLPTDLLEKEEINKLKKNWVLSLGYLNEDKDKFISEEQKKCDEYQSQLNILPKIKSFEQQKLVLEEQLETKEKELDRKTNKAEIKKLQDEISEIVGEIGKINVEIQNLEAIRIMYQNMLTRAENYKTILEEQYEIDKKKYKDSIIYKLNKLYDITSAEG